MAQFPVQRCSHSRDHAEAQDGISGSTFPNLRPWQCRPCCKWLLHWQVHNPWFPPLHTHSVHVCWASAVGQALMWPPPPPSNEEPRAAPSRLSFWARIPCLFPCSARSSMITSWPCTARSRTRPSCSPRSELSSCPPRAPPTPGEACLSLSRAFVLPGPCSSLQTWRWGCCSLGADEGRCERVPDTWVGCPCTDRNSEPRSGAGMTPGYMLICSFTEGLHEISDITPM